MKTRGMRVFMAALLAVASPAPPAAEASAGLVAGPLRLGPGQVARLRVYGLAAGFGSVDLRLLLKDPAGATLASKEATLEAGQTITLELPRAVSSTGAPIPVRGEVEWLTTTTGGPCPKLRATLKIYQATSGQVVRGVKAGPACPMYSEPVRYPGPL